MDIRARICVGRGETNIIEKYGSGFIRIRQGLKACPEIDFANKCSGSV